MGKTCACGAELPNKRARYCSDPCRKAALEANWRRYKATEKGKAARDRYLASEKFRLSRRAYETRPDVRAKDNAKRELRRRRADGREGRRRLIRGPASWYDGRERSW